MFLVVGITGKVGGATARHLSAQGKKVRALVRDRAKAASWTDQGVELVDGDWNNAAAIERTLKGVDGAFVMLPAVWAPSPDFKEAKGVIANYVEALTKAAPPRVVALSSMGANRTSGLGMITALSLLEQGFRDLASPIAFVRAGGFFENFLYGLHVAQGGTLPVYYNPTSRKSTMVATNDIGAEVAALLTGPAWSGRRVIELGSMVSADEVAEQMGEVLKREVKAFAIPRAGWAEAFERFGIPKGHTGPVEEMFEAVNAGWMDLGAEHTEHVAGTTSARDVLRTLDSEIHPSCVHGLKHFFGRSGVALRDAELLERFCPRCT
ncbi:MAG: NmrA family NAD(P)-binding protein, partial [Rhodomicrobium sp.]